MSEAVGLLVDDIRLDQEIPHVARRITSQSGKFAFPRYCSEFKCNANSASAALKK